VNGGSTEALRCSSRPGNGSDQIARHVDRVCAVDRLLPAAAGARTGKFQVDRVKLEFLGQLRKAD
jgi:hypothetical protein